MRRRRLTVYLYSVSQREPGNFITTMQTCIVVAANRDKADESIRDEVKNLRNFRYLGILGVSKRQVKILGPSSIIST